MATQTGVGGFSLYAGGHQFNAQPIPVHRGTTYHYNVRAHLPLSRVDASFKLRVLLRNGSEVIVSVRRVKSGFRLRERGRRWREGLVVKTPVSRCLLIIDTGSIAIAADDT